MPTVQKEARVEVSLCTSFPTVSQALAGPIVPVAQMLVRLHAMLTGINVLSIGASAVLAPGTRGGTYHRRPRVGCVSYLPHEP